MSSILTSAINPIATLSDQVLSEIIVVGSGTSQLKTSLQSFKNSLLPDLRNFGSSVCVMQWTGVIRGETLI
jgi:hypothetical protein